MPIRWVQTVVMLMIIAALVAPSGCAQITSPPAWGRPTHGPNHRPGPSPARGNPASYVYANSPWGSNSVQIYSATSGTQTTLLGTLDLPSIAGGLSLSTDSHGQIYAVGNNGLNNFQIFVFAANATGAAKPLRTIDLNYQVNRVAVDPAGRIYVLDLPANWTTGGVLTVRVYSASANGAAQPMRTFQLKNVLMPVEDISADMWGNLYCTCFFENQWTVAVYSSRASGVVLPNRTINFGMSFLWGVAADPAGDVFVNVCDGCYTSATGIEEFAPGASGTATPINTINFNVESPYKIFSGGLLRLDGAGNLYTALDLQSDPWSSPMQVYYGFAANASGNATPTLEIDPSFTGGTPFFAVH